MAEPTVTAAPPPDPIASRKGGSGWIVALVLTAVACLLVGFCVGVLLCLPGGLWGEEGPWRPTTTGRLEIPAGVALDSLRLVASCSGGTRTTWPEADGTFRVSPPYQDTFDLLVSDWETWRDPYPRDGSPPEPEPTHAWEGELRGLPLGAQNVRLTLTRRALVPARVRVLSSDGRAVAGASVRMESYGDMLSATTDATGLAHFLAVPPRVWRATAGPPHDRTAGLLAGTTEFVPAGAPGGTTVDVRFHPSQPIQVRMAEGVRATRIECRAGGGYTQLDWQPDGDGTITLQVPLAAPTLSVRAIHVKQLDERTTQEGPVGAGAIAIRAGATLLVEPIPR